MDIERRAAAGLEAMCWGWLVSLAGVVLHANTGRYGLLRGAGGMAIVAAAGFVAATVGTAVFALAVGREKGWILRWIAVAATGGVAVLAGASELEAVSGDSYTDTLFLAFLAVPVTLAITGGGMARFCKARGAGRLAGVWAGAIFTCAPSVLIVLGFAVLKNPDSGILICMALVPFAWVGQVECATIAMRRTARVMREGTWDAQQDEPPAEPAGPPSAAAPPPDDTPQDPPDSPVEPSA